MPLLLSSLYITRKLYIVLGNLDDSLPTVIEKEAALSLPS